jgi:integrase/outer membrane murein-binding lipoprotein Lpp
LSSKQTPLWRNDPAYQRWIGTVTRKSTKKAYRSWFKCYIQFTKMTPTQLVDEALKDMKRDPREKRDIVMRRLIDFYHWLKTDYQKKPKGKDKTLNVGKGVTDKVAHARVGAIRSFYGTFGVTVRMKGRRSLPRPRVRNKRMKVGGEQVRVLINHTRTPRDRAMILTLFQGGMDVSTLCSLKYGDISEALAKNEHPVRVDLYRPKTGVEYYTFLGKDAVKAINAYISDMESRGVDFTSNMPLFLKERGKDEGVSTNLVQNMMKTVAKNAKFIDEKNNGKAFNPLGPHALRESFGSLMINSGVPDTIVDFWLGHTIGDMAEAYKGVQFDSLKKMYLEREKLLSVSGPKVDAEEIEEKIRKKVDERNRDLQALVNGLSTRNLNLDRKVTDLASQNQSLKSELKDAKEDLEKNKEELDNTKSRVEKLEKVLPEVRNLREELSKLLSREA